MKFDLVLRVSAPLLIVTAVSSAHGATLSVEPDGTGEYATIRAAMESAVSGDVVSLADGTYVGDDNRNLSYLGKSILVKSASGDPTLCIIDCAGGSGNSRGFLFQPFQTSGARLSGITIIGAHVSSGSDPVGGAIFISSDASPRITNCRFLYNVARHGGAVHIGPGSAASFDNCYFEGNGAEQTAGAVDIYAGSPTFENCRFTLNQSPILGGALRVTTEGTALFSNCEFDQNYSDSGGCIWLYFDSGATFDHCSFRDNGAATEGGVAETWRGSQGQFDHCTFTGNRANHGGVEYVRGITTYTNCTMYDNYAWNGILLVYETGNVTVDRSIIAFSSHGSPVWCGNDGMATVECSNFFGNAGGDWRYCTEALYDGVTNVSVDPFFCDAVNGDLALQNKSWCVEGNNPGCGQVGAFGMGCTITGVPEISGVATGGLHVQPNPTSGVCQISWALSDRAARSLDIYDVMGASVRTIVLPAGTSNATWDGKDQAGRDVPAGVYLVRAAHGSSIGDRNTLVSSRIIVQR